MAALRRGRNERAPAQAQEIVRPHEPEYALGVDDEAFVPEPSRDAPIAFVTAPERQPLDQVAQVRVVARRELGFEPTIVACARQRGDRAKMRDPAAGRAGFALRSFARHFFDDGEEMGAPLPRRLASHDRKASRKKSRSACWRPTRRSSSPICALAFARSSGGRAAGGPANQRLLLLRR